jgi:pyrimidine operon attenuation protein/uracil phosphoribosyltransferase
MSDKQLLILNQQQIQQKIDRIAYQILEDNFDEEEIIIAGILPRGDKIAKRIKGILDEIAPFKSTLINIEIEKQSSSLKSNIDFNVQLSWLTMY